MTEGAYCQHCGAKLAPGSRFCESCGKPIAAVPTPAPPPVPPPAPPPAAAPAAPAVVPAAPPPVAPPASPPVTPPVAPPGAYQVPTQSAPTYAAPAPGLPWYLRPSVYAAATLLVFLLIGIAVMVMKQFSHPDTSALATGDTSIASDLGEGSKENVTSSEGIAPDVVNAEKPAEETASAQEASGGEGPGAAGAGGAEGWSLTDALSREGAGLHLYARPWRIVEGAGEVDEAARTITFRVTANDHLVADVPALEGKFDLQEVTLGIIKGTFKTPEATTPVYLDMNFDTRVLTIKLAPPASEPQILTCRAVEDLKEGSQ